MIERPVAANSTRMLTPKSAPLTPKSVERAMADPLIAAVEANDLAAVRDLLAVGADVNSRREPLFAMWNGDPVPMSAGPTALMLAMRGGHDDIASLLLGKKADATLQDQFKKTAAMYALEFGQVQMRAVYDIIQRVPDKLTDHWGHNLIVYSSLEGAIDVIGALLKSDPDGSTIKGTVKDGADEELDLLSLTAKHGKGRVITQLLQSTKKNLLLEASRNNAKVGARPGGKAGERRLQRGERGISAALILACISGHWIDSLVEATMDEINEPDAHGMTPIMHALAFGQDEVVRRLIAKGVDVTAKAPVSDGQGGRQLKSMLMVALEQTKTQLETVKDLVRAGARTELPPLSDRRYLTAELFARLRDPSHAIGRALSEGCSASEPEDVDRKYAMVRVMLAAAFGEAPGAALCACVAIALTMREHAKRVQLADLALSEHLIAEALEVGKTVGVLLKTLPEIERERLLRSVAGENFLRFAAESHCRTMLHSAHVVNHIEARWQVPLRAASFISWPSCLSTQP